jgi:uncharacterized membrane protein YdjX (TVP38/TMEM64 family)
MPQHRSAFHWILLCTILLALIIVPFLVFGKNLEAWATTWVEQAREHSWTTALVLGGLLASDILLPIPSSIVSTACGSLLGVGLGALTSCVGMVISCVAGYGLARGPGRSLTGHFLSPPEADRMEAMSQRFGNWALVIARPVPVLAEASVLMAGLARMPFARFLLLTTLSNAGISLIYAGLGDQSFFLALAVSLLLPGLLMIAGKRSSARRRGKRVNS